MTAQSQRWMNAGRGGMVAWWRILSYRGCPVECVNCSRTALDRGGRDLHSSNSDGDASVLATVNCAGNNLTLTNRVTHEPGIARTWCALQRAEEISCPGTEGVRSKICGVTTHNTTAMSAWGRIWLIFSTGITVQESRTTAKCWQLDDCPWRKHDRRGESSDAPTRSALP